MSPDQAIRSAPLASLRAALIAVGVMLGGTVLAFLGWSNDLNTVRQQQDRLENRMQSTERTMDRIESKLDALKERRGQQP